MLSGIEPNTPTPSLNRQGKSNYSRSADRSGQPLHAIVMAAEEASNCAKGWAKPLFRLDGTSRRQSCRGLRDRAFRLG